MTIVMTKAFLVDDEQKALDALSGALTSFVDEVTVCGTASTVREAYEGIVKTKPDLVFLDVEMGRESGFELLELFSKINFHVAFVTAHEEYALRAIKFSALDYLIKPASIKDLSDLVQKVRQNPLGNQEDQRVKHMFSNFLSRDMAEHKLSLPVVDGFEFVKVDRIMYILAHSSYSEIVLTDHSRLVGSRPLRFFEEILTEYGFCRIHKSTLINLKYIKAYRKAAGGVIEMEDGAEFPVARTRKDEIQKLMPLR